MSDIFTGKVCTFYKNVVEHKAKNVLSTPGRVIAIQDVLTNERYTNSRLLNELRNSGYKSDFYLKYKNGLSAACFSSVQDDLTVDRSDKNHLFHTGFIAFDIDVDNNKSLLYPGGADEMKDFIIDNVPYIAYLGKSVSNLGLWGLVPISNKDDHYAHFKSIVKYFGDRRIFLDSPLSDISRLRFIAYDPDAHFELNPAIYEDTLFDVENGESVTNRYERATPSDEFFRVACLWVEQKHGIKFQQGSKHNYLLALYSTLRFAHVSRKDCLKWIFDNLIKEAEITTNCLDEVKFNK